jgi:quercetin 2,3-dioxygenase
LACHLVQKDKALFFSSVLFRAHLVSDVQSEAATAVKVNQDVNLFVTEVAPGVQVQFEVKEGRQAYMLCVEGSGDFVTTNSSGSSSTNGSITSLSQHDAAELYGPLQLTAAPSGEEKLHVLVLVLEMEYTGTGRSDL